jgi:hypothetical protein
MPNTTIRFAASSTRTPAAIGARHSSDLKTSIPERAAHVVGGGRNPAGRIQDGALEIAEAGETQGLDRPHHGGVGRADALAECRRRARQHDLAIFIDESRDPAAGSAELRIGAAQELIQVDSEFSSVRHSHGTPADRIPLESGV